MSLRESLWLRDVLNEHEALLQSRKKHVLQAKNLFMYTTMNKVFF